MNSSTMLPLSHMDVLLRYQLYRSAKEEYLNQKEHVELINSLSIFQIKLWFWPFLGLISVGVGPVQS